MAGGVDAVVSMGGYNTVCKVLAAGPPLLVVPRVRPRTEQLVRAERLAAAGLLDVLHPDRLDPAALGGWLAEATGPRSARAAFLAGLGPDDATLARAPAYERATRLRLAGVYAFRPRWRELARALLAAASP